MQLAHEKWFVDDPSAFGADWSFFLRPIGIGLVVASLAYTLLWRRIALHFGSPELSFLRPLGRLAPWVPRLLAIHLGVKLLSLAVDNAYLAPSLDLPTNPVGTIVAIGEGLVGVWLISGVGLRPAALAVALMGPVALILAGPVAMLEAADVLGIALFLAVLPPGRNGWGRVDAHPERVGVAVWALRMGVGGALVVLAFSEKFANFGLAEEFLDRYPAFDLFSALGLEVGAETFVLIAAALELTLGLLLLSGAAPQVLVLVAAIPFNAGLFTLGRTELIGHLPIYGAMLALLVYGSSERHAPETARLWPFKKHAAKGASRLSPSDAESVPSLASRPPSEPSSPIVP